MAWAHSNTVLLSFAVAFSLATQSVESVGLRSPGDFKTIYSFPVGNWIENIARRLNGDILVTLLNVPEIHRIRQSADAAKHSLIHSFVGTPNITGLLGIREYEPDVFAFVAGNASTIPGVYSIWKADFGDYGNNDQVAVTKIADVPQGQLLNGLTTLNEHTLLISDSVAGTVISLNTRTGESEVVLDDASMKPGRTPSGAFTPGINGVRVLGKHLHFTNMFTGTLTCVRLNCDTGAAIGPFETVATDLNGADDFALQNNGKAFVAIGPRNSVETVYLNGVHEVLIGSLNSSTVPGPTSATLGKTRNDVSVLYISTNGGLRAPVNGTYVEGGKIVAIRV